MTIYLIVSLPGAGKTARAKELESSEPALRLTPDDWQFAIFRGDNPTRWRSNIVLASVTGSKANSWRSGCGLPS
jgi:predicted kinase